MGLYRATLPAFRFANLQAFCNSIRLKKEIEFIQRFSNYLAKYMVFLSDLINHVSMCLFLWVVATTERGKEISAKQSVRVF